MIWSWIISQLLMIIYIRLASWHHAPAVKAMRDYIPTPNPYEDPFHFWSFGQGVVVSIIIAASMLSYQPWGWCIVSGVLCGLWYSLLFDPWLNKQIPGRNWNYLGNDPGIDRFLKRIFGKHAGEYKFVICGLLIVLINLLKLFL